MATWISMDEACELLGVRRQTIYAYVSRGKLEVMTDPHEARRSLYRKEDVLVLAKRKQAGRKHETLASNALFGAEPSIPTELSTFARGRPYYRGQDVVELANTGTLEEVAQLLWKTDAAVEFPLKLAVRASQPGRATAFATLAQLAATGLSTRGRAPAVLNDEARQLVGQVARAYGAMATDAPALLHQSFAKSWNQPRAVADLLRQALVLMADHEMTSSAFAARIAASTGASLPASLLAGLMTLSGPLHGDASMRVQALFAEVERLGEDQVIHHYLSTGTPLPGFGHAMYVDGDPRGAALLARFDPPKTLARFIRKVTDATGLQPNIDIALAAMVVRFRLPTDAAFGLMATARSVGLLAHTMEQLKVAQTIRPRGKYVGVPPPQVETRR